MDERNRGSGITGPGGSMMASPLHISFRNLSLSDHAENLCWREAAALSDMPGVENCRLRIDGAIEDDDDDGRSARITLDFRIHGRVIHIAEPVASSNGHNDAKGPLFATLRAVILRGCAAAAARE